ncbi:hypothetical protein ACP70R_017829 [Stipagrostis hirtigluma subsp. patula]
MAIIKWSSTDADESFAEESEVVANLSDDVLGEIIRRLPVKSVARSKCVSKNWCATISDGYLRRRLPLHLSVVYYPDGGSGGPRFACASGGERWLEDCDLTFFPLMEGAVVCDACNGLLLLCRSSAGAPRRSFYVVDPVARRWAALPAPARDARLSVLAFDPRSSPHYHVVNFTGWRDRGAAVEVFSSEAWAWAARDVDFGVPADSLSAASLHSHGGAVYILASDDADRAVVRMDVAAAFAPGADPACTAIELPEQDDGGDGRVAHSGGRLHYVGSDRELLKVWVLDDDDSSSSRQWRLKHAVKVDDVVEGGCRGREVRFLALHPEKDAVYLWMPWKLVEFDLAKKAITGAWEFGGKDQNGAKNRIVKTWLVPSSWYLSDCLANGHVQ